MMEEAPAPTSEQEPSTEDRIRALSPTPSTEDRVKAMGSQATEQAADSFVINQGATKDPDKAARAIRISRRYGLPDNFAEQNLETLEAEEKKGAFKSQDLLNNNPKVAELAAQSPNWSSLVHREPNLPLLQKLEMLYQRTPDEWPKTEAEYGPDVQARYAAYAKRDWEAYQKNPTVNGVDEYGRPFPLIYSSLDQMAEAYVKAGMARRAEEERYIGGTAPVEAAEAFTRRASENPFFFAPFGGDAFDVARIVDLKNALGALNDKTATPDQVDELRQWARLQKAAERRGTSFTGKLTEQLMTLPAFMGELAATDGIYSAVEGGLFKAGGKELAEQFLKGQLRKALEKGFATSLLKKGVSSAIAAAPQAVLSRSLAGLSSELQQNLQQSYDSKQITEDADGNVHLAPMPGQDKPISIPGTVYGSLVRAYSDIVSVKAGSGLTQPLDNAVLGMLSKLPGVSAGGNIAKTAADKLRDMGINSFLGMMTQGEIGKGILAAGGLQKYQAPTREDAAIAFLTGALPHALTLPFDIASARSALRESQTKAEAFKRRGEMTAELLKESPDLKGEALAKVAEGGVHSTTYVPADKFEQAVFTDDADNVIHYRDMLQKLGVGDAQYQGALAAKQDFPVQSAAWDEAVGQHPQGREFDAVLKSNPDEMSHDEAMRYVQKVAADMAAEQRSREAKERNPVDVSEKLVGKPSEGKLSFKYSDSPEGFRLQEAEERIGGPASAFSDERARKDILPEREDRIRRDLQEAHDRNVEAYTKLVQEENERRTSKEWADKKEKLKPEIAKEIDAIPACKNAARLANHTNPDGSPLPEGTPELKLSRSAVNAMLKGSDIKLPPGVTDAAFPEGRGYHPDDVAQMLGYVSGHELLRDLDTAKYEPRDKAIEREAEFRMGQKYDKLQRSPEEAREEALRIVNRDYAAKIMKADRDWIFSNKLSTAKGMLDEARRHPIADEMVESMVKGILKDMPSHQIDPRIAEAAERRAGVEAESGIWKGDWETAFDAIQRRIINHEFWRQATEAKGFSEGLADDLVKDPWRPVFNKPGNAEYGQQMKALAERLGLRTVSAKDMAGRMPLGDWLTSIEQGEAMETGLKQIEIDPRFRDESYRPKFEEMTYGDHQTLGYALEQLKYIAKEKNQSTLHGERIEDGLIVNAVLEEIRKANPEQLPKRGLTYKPGTLKTADKFFQRPEEFLIRLIGDRVDSVLAEMTINRAGACQGQMFDLRKEYRQRMEKLRDGIPDEVTKRQNELIKVPGLDTAVTRKEAIGMVLNGGNESNYMKMVEGEKLRSQRRGLTEEQIKGVTSQLTRAEVLYAQGIFDIHQDLWPRIAELEKRLSGIEPPKIPIKAILPCLEREGCEGGYYHMMADITEPQGKRNMGQVQVSKELGQLIQPSYASATMAGGYRESRNQSVYPLDYNLDRHTGFMSSMLQDLTHREFMIDMNKLATNPEIRAEIRDRFGPEYMDFLKDWNKRIVNDYARPSDQSVSAAGRWMGTLRSNITNVAMGYRMTTLLKHTFTVEPCIDAIGKGNLADGGKYFYRGVKEFFSHPFDNWKAIKEESPEMRGFHETSDANLMDTLTDLEGKDTFYSKAKRFGMYFSTFGNILRAGCTYLGAKAKALEDYAKLGQSGEELNRSAILEGERAVRLSIGSGAPKDIPAAMGRDNQAMRAFTMFYTPGSMSLSRAMSIVSGFGKDKNIPRLLMRTMGWWIGGAVLHHLASMKAPDEEKDQTWGGELGKAVLKYPLGTLPGGSQAEPLIDRMMGEKTDISRMPILAPFTDAYKTLDKALDAANDEGDWDEAVKQFIKTSGYATGAPTGQLTDSAGYLYDVMADKADPNDMGEFMHDLLFHRKKQK